MNIVVAFNPVEYEDKRRRKSQEDAILALSLAPKHIFPIAFGFRDDKPNLFVKSLNIPTLNILDEDSSKIIENERRLPYINEIMDCCSRIDCEIFGYINSDILLNKEFWTVLNPECNKHKDAFIFERFEIGEVNDVQKFYNDSFTKPIYGGDKHDGNDAFFFFKNWYVSRKTLFDQYPLIIGEHQWDAAYRLLIKKSTDFVFEGRQIYHVYHSPKWNKESVGAKNNIEMFKKIQKWKE